MGVTERSGPAVIGIIVIAIIPKRMSPIMIAISFRREEVIAVNARETCKAVLQRQKKQVAPNYAYKQIYNK